VGFLAPHPTPNLEDQNDNLDPTLWPVWYGWPWQELMLLPA